jgi:ADP-ribosylglycohydrolase
VVAAGVTAADLGRKLGPVWIGASVGRRIEMAVEIASGPRPERARLQDLYDRIGSSLAIPESVAAAFGVLVMAEGDPLQAATFAAALSGDADTVGAMACAIAGAWRGSRAFTPEIAARLVDANPELDFLGTAAGLTRLAEQNAA